MIPQAYITAWRQKAPWQENFQVEQDLVIERALMAIYNDEYLRSRLAFRGGTALHKLYLSPAARYSEDIDLVQITAEALIPTYDLAELLGTKMRALYQRRKGRDLFDMWLAITQTDVNIDQIIKAWHFYMNEEGNSVSQKEFLENMEKKIEDQDFLADMAGLLRPSLKYDIRVAHDFVKTALLEKI